MIRIIIAVLCSLILLASTIIYIKDELIPRYKKDTFVTITTFVFFTIITYLFIEQSYHLIKDYINN